MERELTLIEHLAELRTRIIISLAALIAGILISFPFASLFLWLLKRPASGLIEKLVYFSPQEAFSIHMQVAVLAGWFIGLPVILYEAWLFICPAVEERLRKFIVVFVFFSFAAFICGGIFAYFVLIPPALKFLLSFGSEELQPMISAQKYISFITTLIFGCGLVFEMPILSFILSRLRVITARALRDKYKFAVVAIFIIAAIITPTTDLFNMALMAAPMIFLYEISIWVAYFARPKVKPVSG